MSQANSPSAPVDCQSIIDPNRVSKECFPVVYGILITPDTSISARVYDMVNRRWYELNVASDIRDEDWIVNTVATHVKASTAPFNVITVDSAGVATCSTRAPSTVGIQVPVSSKFEYPRSRFPTVDVNDILQKEFMSRTVDRCTWNGETCVYKQIVFEEDILCIQREILVREELMERDGSFGSDNMRKHGICPILAVVINTNTRLTEGLLLEYVGTSLVHVTENSTESTPTITLHHLAELIEGVISEEYGYDARRHMRTEHLYHGEE